MVLAAGLGTRVQSISGGLPKVMLEIDGKPVLVHIIELLRKYGISDIAINLHYRPEAIRNCLKDGKEFRANITYSLEKELLGSAGAVKKLGNYFDRTFLVIYGDLLTRINLEKLVAFHRRNKGMGTIALYRVSNPCSCGVVGINAEKRITSFVEKPEPDEVFSNLANAGIYVFEPDLIRHIPEGFCDFGKDVFPALLQKGLELFGWETDDYLIDIGLPENYEKARADWKELSRK